MMITTQVLDTTRGLPAARIPVELDYFVTPLALDVHVDDGIVQRRG